MSTDTAKRFYSSKAWQDCRNAYAKSVGGLCERCMKKGMIVPGEIVHHKEYINAHNVNDPQILTDFANLELLCRQCHTDEHRHVQHRYKIDDLGRVLT